VKISSAVGGPYELRSAKNGARSPAELVKHLRRIIFWIHFALGIGAGLAGALMAGTAIIMAFADTYLDVRDHEARRVAPLQDTRPRSLEELAALVLRDHPGRTINRVGLDRNPKHALEFYFDKDGLEYVDPWSGERRPSDSVPLRRSLHKGVEQWHRFFGLAGERRETGKKFASWFNAALVPLLLTGFILWWPARLRWTPIRASLLPAGIRRGGGTQRSWHVSLGFWALPFLLVMVLTGTIHSFAWVRNTAQRLAPSGSSVPGGNDQLWPPGLPKRPASSNLTPLSLDSLVAIADRELPGWTRLDVFPPPPPKENQTDAARLLAKAPGRGPGFFPMVLQVDPFTGAVLDLHSWDDLSGSTRILAWVRWLHKGEAFGHAGQIIAGLACLVMLVLIVTGWSLAIRRLRRGRALEIRVK